MMARACWWAPGKAAKQAPGEKGGAGKTGGTM